MAWYCDLCSIISIELYLLHYLLYVIIFSLAIFIKYLLYHLHLLHYYITCSSTSLPAPVETWFSPGPRPPQQSSPGAAAFAPLVLVLYGSHVLSAPHGHIETTHSPSLPPRIAQIWISRHQTRAPVLNALSAPSPTGSRPFSPPSSSLW